MNINKIQLAVVYMFLALNLFVLITAKSPYQKILCTMSLICFLLFLKSQKSQNKK